MRRPRYTLIEVLLLLLAPACVPVFGQSVSIFPYSSSVAFGPVAVGNTSTASTVTLTNVGTSLLALSSIAATDDFKLSDGCGSTLASGKSCSLAIQFVPRTIGVIDGSITIIDNASDSPQVVSLSGTGLVPVGLSPTSLTFGSTAIGKTSLPKKVVVKNNGNTSINIMSLVSSGDFNSNNCGSTLAANATCTLSVTFSPTATGSIEGAITISDSAINSPQILNLSGVGTGADSSPLTLTPGTLTFPSQVIGTVSTSQNVTVKNGSSTSIPVTISSSGDYTETNTCSGGIDPHGSCTISVKFTPTTMGTVSGGITVSYPGTDSPQIVGLAGNGISSLTFFPATLSFSVQTIGSSSSPKTIKLTNNEKSFLSITSILVSGDFSETNTCGTRISAGSSCTISVRYTPTEEGSILGSITVTDSASDSPQVVDLAGAAPFARFGFAANGDGTVSTYVANPALSGDTLGLGTGQLRSSGYMLTGLTNPTAVAVTPSYKFAYVVSSIGGTSTDMIAAYAINSSSGALTPVPGSPYPVGQFAKSITVDPFGKYVYVPNQNSANISAFTINPSSGALTEIKGSPFPAGESPESIGIDPSGNFAYVADELEGILAYKINRNTGVLTPMTGSPFPDPNTPVSITVDPFDKFVFVANQGGSQTGTGTISAFTINLTTGALAQVANSPFTITGPGFPLPDQVTVDPSGRYVYAACINAGSKGYIAGFVIDSSTGELAQMQTSPFTAGLTPTSVTIDPSGMFAYVTNGGDNTIGVYNVFAGGDFGATTNMISARYSPMSFTLSRGSANPVYTPKFVYSANLAGTVDAYTINLKTGALTTISGSPFVAGPESFGVAADPYGRFLYVVNQVSAGTISGYSINPVSGVLTAIPNSPFPAGSYPDGVIVDASGRFVYVADDAGGILGFSIDQNTGVLTQITSVSAGGAPLGLAVDPAGKFLYVANYDDATVSAFLISSGTGVLSPVSGSPFAAGTYMQNFPTSLAVDPTGKFAYVITQSFSEIPNLFAYSINATTGALAPITCTSNPNCIAGQPIFSPQQIVLDPTGSYLYFIDIADQAIAGFSINRATGSTAKLLGSPFLSQMNPSSLVVDPSSSFVFCTNESSNTNTGGTSTFSLDLSSGDLLERQDAQDLTKPNPIAVTVLSTLK